MNKQYEPHFPTAKIKKMIQMNQDIGKLSNSIPHLLQHSLQIFLTDLMDQVNRQANKSDLNKLTPILITRALSKLQKYKFLEGANIEAEQEQAAPKRKRNSKQNKQQPKPRKKKRSPEKEQEQANENQQDEQDI